jgi:hypothetical protein
MPTLLAWSNKGETIMLGVYLIEGVKGIAVIVSMYMIAEAIRLWCGG